MPANLTPQYRQAEKEFRQAKTREEKIACLENMLRLIPKHKGTDHMQGDIRRKLSKLRQESAKSGKGKRAPIFMVEKEGAGQLLLLGAPNAGKSQLIASLTNAYAAVADYPFTTHAPQPGMAHYEDVQIQLVDTPPITADFLEPWIPDMVRRADGVLLVADLGSDDVLDGVDVILKRLAAVKIELVRKVPPELEDPTRCVRKAAVIANKMDLADAAERLEALKEFYADRFDLWPVSATRGRELDALPARLFKFLKIIRVYTKEPGRKADMKQPYTVPLGSTVLDLATNVHREFEQTLRSARIWGSGKYDGIHVKRDHVLRNGDIVELHE